MVDKGKKPSNGEDDDILKLMIMDYDKQYQKPMVSPFPSASSSHENTETDVMLLPSDENDNNVVSSCSSSESSDETDNPEADQVFSKFLALGNPGFASCEPPTNQFADNDLESVVQMAAQQNRVAPDRASATRAPRPFRALRKAMPPEMLARLAMQDPKKARRIITNRMSAVRAKEKKKLYTYMLEHKLHTLRSAAASSNATLALLQTESIALTSENARLKEQAGMVIRQIQFQDSLNEEVRNEVHHLRMLTQMGRNPNDNQGQEMMLNNVNQNINNNNVNNNVEIATEQFFPANDDNNNQNYHHHHPQVPDYPFHHQLEDIGVAQTNIGQQYPWQLQQVQPTHLEEGDIIPPFINPEVAGTQEINPFFYQQQQQDDGRN